MRYLLPELTTEKQFQQAVERVLKNFGWLHYHTYDSRRSEPGFPDIVAVRGNRLLFAELKTARGRLRPAQQQWLSALRQVESVDVFLWRPADMEFIIEYLWPHGRSREVPALDESSQNLISQYDNTEDI